MNKKKKRSNRFCHQYCTFSCGGKMDRNGRNQAITTKSCVFPSLWKQIQETTSSYGNKYLIWPRLATEVRVCTNGTTPHLEGLKAPWTLDRNNNKLGDSREMNTTNKWKPWDEHHKRVKAMRGTSHTKAVTEETTVRRKKVNHITSIKVTKVMLKLRAPHPLYTTRFKGQQSCYRSTPV